jgi:RNA-dependent RNA polymerase
MELAELCSRAVDYSKHGNPIDIDNGALPRLLSRFKPDWHKAEIADPREVDYYESDRALGFLYRNIHLHDLSDPVAIPVYEPGPPLTDAISVALAPLVQRALIVDANDPDVEPEAALHAHADGLFSRYARELRYIRATHTLTDMPGMMLAEEEVILGAILSTCTQARWRQDRTYRMRLHAEALVGDTRRGMFDDADADDAPSLRCGLRRAWAAWCWAQESAGREGTQSFGLLVLGAVFDCLKKLGCMPEPLPQMPIVPQEDEDPDDW